MVDVSFLNTDDHNRIVLAPIPGHNDCQRDYINACYIDVSIYVTISYVMKSLQICWYIHHTSKTTSRLLLSVKGIITHCAVFIYEILVPPPGHSSIADEAWYNIG